MLSPFITPVCISSKTFVTEAAKLEALYNDINNKN